MEMQIYFSDEQKRHFLRKKGYTIAVVKSWRSTNGYHGEAEFEDIEVEIAYLPCCPPSNEVMNGEQFRLVAGYSLKNVFRVVMSEALLAL